MFKPRNKESFQSKVCEMFKKEATNCSKHRNKLSFTQPTITQQYERTYKMIHSNPADNHMFKVSNRNTKPSCEICSKLTIKTSERRHWRRSGFFIINFEHISHLVLMFLLLTLRR